jgi:hypothetical protein
VQLSLQVPPTQASPATHALPQEPQFCGSVEMSAVHMPVPPLPVPPLSPSPSPPPLGLEQATKLAMPTRIEPPNIHLLRKLLLEVVDRMGRPFMMFT